MRGGGIIRTLVYKRTRKGDPDRKGYFGIQDCMGRVRGYKFDAVIGVGGISSMPTAQGISGKVNWIGVGSRKGPTEGRGPLVTFDHFVLFKLRRCLFGQSGFLGWRFPQPAHIFSGGIRVFFQVFHSEP